MPREPTEDFEVFCVRRHPRSQFLGGAVVFPGGKVDPSDRDAAWAPLAADAQLFSSTDDQATARAFAIAACREAFEEAAILVATTPMAHEDVVALRDQLEPGAEAFQRVIRRRGLCLDLARLMPFGRWVTPTAESRRFDTRFFLALAPEGQRGAHDAVETTSGFWARPTEVLDQFDRAEVELAPPTHRSLSLLRDARSIDGAFALARSLAKAPICPKLVPVPDRGDGRGPTMALVLPGDEGHDDRDVLVPGPSRFVLRGQRWLPE
jgi:8-oxo-dGTP pyrophosphatase MutT (NUDIX family)